MASSGKIANNLVKDLETGETLTLSSLWKEGACVIQFLRRFGCPVCRMGARDLSHLKPRLDAANVRLIAIGQEEAGAKEFVESGFWTGDLFINQHKKIYEDLNYKRYNFLTIVAGLLYKSSREAVSRAKREGISGDMNGDTLQLGGTMVIDKDGKVLLDFKQEAPADSVPLDRVLHVLGIGRPGRMPSLSKEPRICNDNEQCQF